MPATLPAVAPAKHTLLLRGLAFGLGYRKVAKMRTFGLFWLNLSILVWRSITQCGPDVASTDLRGQLFGKRLT